MESVFWTVVLSVIVYLLMSRASKYRIGVLERKLEELNRTVEALKLRQAGLPDNTAAPGTQAGAAAPTQTAAPPEPADAVIPETPAVPVPAMAAKTTPDAARSLPHAGAADAAPPPAAAPLPPAPVRVAPAWLQAARNWLFNGNLVAKLGLLILFIGVSFLLKYTAERVTVPIELRLAGIVLADIALLAWGWRIRLARPNISLPVQGGALGIMMLVTFGAFRIYHLIPSGLAFSLLFVLTTFTCVLAVLQNAMWLAVFGIVGGFFAPIMTSTGQGSHIALFSYYALLNAGILAIALKRTWRVLNLLGFGFTFVIGTAWGVLRYSAEEHYLSTQSFLLLFFLFYVAIALVYAARQAPQLKHYVDATLVFGTPLLAFGLQLGLMKHTDFGNAYSALGFGLFYTVLALALWSRRGTQFKMLVESFLALGLVFGTLALPFALDGRWTSAAWALEGAGVVWIGLRQRQRLTWMFGLLVQGGAWISFIGAVSGLDRQAALESNLWLGFMLLAVTAFLMAANFRAQQDAEGSAAFPRAAGCFLALAAVWLMAGAWTEIVLRTSGTTQANLLAASGLFTAVVLAIIASRMRWDLARRLAVLAQFVAGIALLATVMFAWDWGTATANPFDKPLLGALLIAAGAFVTGWNLWRMPQDARTPALARALLAWSACWWFGPILNALSGSMTLMYVNRPGAYSIAAEWWSIYFLCIAASALAFARLARRLTWDDARWLSASAWAGLLLVTIGLLAQLYMGGELPGALAWTTFALLWASAEYLIRCWPASGWHIGPGWLKALHLLRTAGPWLMLWKSGEILISDWMAGAPGERALLEAGGWTASGSWANFVPAWAMMLAIVWLIGRSRGETWPAAPIAAWYRRVLIPGATLWSLLLVVVWNIRQDGAMAPLPYLPLANPLDLSTGFALLLGVACYRMLRAEGDALEPGLTGMLGRLPALLPVAAYVWFNLVLLRSAAHYLPVPYRAGALFDSQFVQAMLSLVWSVTALLLMWRAAGKSLRKQWLAGAALLGLVVGKLFLVDLSNVGGVERIVSFVGVGLLMVLIGYLAPYPTQADGAPEPART